MESNATTTPASPTSTNIPAVPGLSSTQMATDRREAESTQGNGTEIHKEEAPKPKEAPQYFEKLVNGQMRRYSLEDLLSKTQLADAAHEKFQIAAQQTKEHSEFQERLKKNPLATLEDPKFGLSRDQIKSCFEKWYHENYILPETLSPSEKRAMELQRENEKLKEEFERTKQVETKRQQDQMDSHYRAQVQQDIIKAIDDHKLPKTRFTASRIAFYLNQNIKNGFDAPMEVIVNQVKEESRAIIHNLLSTMSADQMVEVFGEDLIKKLRDFDLGRLKTKFSKPAKDPFQAPSQKDRKTMSDVDKYFNELRQTR